MKFSLFQLAPLPCLLFALSLNKYNGMSKHQNKAHPDPTVKVFMSSFRLCGALSTWIFSWYGTLNSSKGTKTQKHFGAPWREDFVSSTTSSRQEVNISHFTRSSLEMMKWNISKTAHKPLDIMTQCNKGGRRPIHQYEWCSQILMVLSRSDFYPYCRYFSWIIRYKRIDIHMV